MAHIRPPSFWDGIVVDVDDAIEVKCDNLCDIMQLLEVVHAIADESGQREGGQVANGGLVGRGVLNDLRAQVG